MNVSTSERFGRRHRILKSADFGGVFARARRSGDDCFTVLSARNETGHARLGLAISKKHCRKATARNRLKRIVRESFRRHLDVLEGLDIVVMNRPAAANAENGALFESLDRHWKRVGARRPVDDRDAG